MLSLLAMIGLVLFFCVSANRRFEVALPTVFCLWMLLLTALAAMNALYLLDRISVGILVLVILAFLYLMLRDKENKLLRRAWRNIFTPGLVVFLILAVVLYYLCESMVVWWADDVFYWALEPKGLWYLGGLSDSLGSIVDGFATYTPGMPVMQWQVLHFFNDYSESLLYYTLYLSYAIFLLPLTSKLTWRQWWAIPLLCVALIALPLLGNALSYTFLGVDTALASCFAFVLIILRREPRDRLALLLGLCGLVLIKENGILLCLLALIFALMERGNKSNHQVSPNGAWYCWFAPLFTIGAWAAFCLWKGYKGAGDGYTLGQLTAVVNGTYQLPASWNLMPASLWYAITHMPSTVRLLTALPLVAIPKLGWIVLLNLFPLALIPACGRKPMIRLSLFVFIGSVCYLGLILLSFAITFNREIAAYSGENVNNLSLLLERYLAPLMLGIGALELWLAMEALLEKKLTKIGKTGVVTTLSLVLILCFNWGSLGDTLWPAGYESRADTISVTAQTEETNFWSDALQDRVGAVVLIGFGNDSEYIENLNYTFAPARFLLPDERSGDAVSLKEQIRERKANYIVCLDDSNELYQGASQLTQDGYLDTYTLYAIVDDGENISLETVE